MQNDRLAMATRGPATSLESTREAIARTIASWTRGSEDRPTAIQDLLFFRREAPTPPGVCLIEPSVVLVVQGAKRMLVGEDAYAYDARHFLLASHDIPASSEVVEASSNRPCLGLVLKLDLRLVTELATRIQVPISKDRSVARGMALGVVTETLLDPIKRLTDLLDEPDAIEVMAPLIQREIHFRLLKSDQAGRLRLLASVGSQSHLVTRAIDWLKANYASSFRVEELSERVHMSASSLHHHFRQLTGMSPLQYQKWLRLNEARRLMLNKGFDSGSAALEVGYESPSQFSREYARLFGAPPKRDVIGLRADAARATALST
jgi:AraC-like DNA-binding protein